MCRHVVWCLFVKTRDISFQSPVFFAQWNVCGSSLETPVLVVGLRVTGMTFVKNCTRLGEWNVSLSGCVHTAHCDSYVFILRTLTGMCSYCALWQVCVHTPHTDRYVFILRTVTGMCSYCALWQVCVHTAHCDRYVRTRTFKRVRPQDRFSLQDFL